jgi:hypothetical protein
MWEDGVRFDGSSSRVELLQKHRLEVEGWDGLSIDWSSCRCGELRTKVAGRRTDGRAMVIII